MDQQKTLFDKFLSRIKNNPIVAVLLLIGTIFMAAATFTDSIQKILVFLPKEETSNVTGKWRTQAFINPYDKNEQSILLFEFIQKGDTLSGTVTEMDVDGSNDVYRNMIDGKIKENVVSFYTQGETDDGPYKETYFGSLNKKKEELAFIRMDNLPGGGIPEKFIATRNP